MTRISTLIVCCGALTAAESTHAAFINNSSGIASPVYTVTFSEHNFGTGTIITNQFADVGVVFNPHVYFNPIGNNFPNMAGNFVGNFNLSGVINPVSIRFTQARVAAAFAMSSNTSTMTLTALLNGIVVETAQAQSAVTNENNFYGFTDILFDEIRIFQGPTSGGNQGLVIDNIQLGAVPAPPVAGLLLLAALGSRRRRR